MANQIGKYSLIAGIVISVVLGLGTYALVGSNGLLFSILVVLGLITGFASIKDKNAKDFLLVAFGLSLLWVIAQDNIEQWASINFIGDYLFGFFNALMSFIVAATFSAALKTLWNYVKLE